MFPQAVRFVCPLAGRETRLPKRWTSSVPESTSTRCDNLRSQVAKDVEFNLPIDDTIRISGNIPSVDRQLLRFPSWRKVLKGRACGRRNMLGRHQRMAGQPGSSATSHSMPDADMAMVPRSVSKQGDAMTSPQQSGSARSPDCRGDRRRASTSRPDARHPSGPYG